MIDILPNDRQQVDQLSFQRLELRPQLRHRRLQPANLRLLERRIHRDPLGVLRRLDHRAHQLRARVMRALGEILSVPVGAVASGFVIAELCRCLLPRHHGGPHGHRALDRLEIEKPHLAVERL